MTTRPANRAGSHRPRVGGARRADPGRSIDMGAGPGFPAAGPTEGKASRRCRQWLKATCGWNAEIRDAGHSKNTCSVG